jgi:hypothetical protein
LQRIGEPVVRSISYFRFCDYLVNSSRAIRMAFGISAVVVSHGLMFAPAAFAQDAMQLDIDFKNSLSQGPHVQGPHVQGSPVQESLVQGRHREARRAEKGRQREKGLPVEAIARR